MNDLHYAIEQMQRDKKLWERIVVMISQNNVIA